MEKLAGMSRSGRLPPCAKPVSWYHTRAELETREERPGCRRCVLMPFVRQLRTMRWRSTRWRQPEKCEPCAAPEKTGGF